MRKAILALLVMAIAFPTLKTHANWQTGVFLFCEKTNSAVYSVAVAPNIPAEAQKIEYRICVNRAVKEVAFTQIDPSFEQNFEEDDIVFYLDNTGEAFSFDLIILEEVAEKYGVECYVDIEQALDKDGRQVQIDCKRAGYASPPEPENAVYAHNITVEGFTTAPAFSKSIYEYSINVPHDTQTVNIIVDPYLPDTVITKHIPELIAGEIVRATIRLERQGVTVQYYIDICRAAAPVQKQTAEKKITEKTPSAPSKRTQQKAEVQEEPGLTEEIEPIIIAEEPQAPRTVVSEEIKTEAKKNDYTIPAIAAVATFVPAAAAYYMKKIKKK